MARPNLHLSKCQIVVHLMTLLICHVQKKMFAHEATRLWFKHLQGDLASVNAMKHI